MLIHDHSRSLSVYSRFLNDRAVSVSAILRVRSSLPIVLEVARGKTDSKEDEDEDELGQDIENSLLYCSAACSHIEGARVDESHEH